MAWQTVGTQIQRPETELRGEKEFIVYFSQRGRKAVVRLRIARIQQTDCPGFGWSGRRVDGSGEQAGSQAGRWRDWCRSPLQREPDRTRVGRQLTIAERVIVDLRNINSVALVITVGYGIIWHRVVGRPGYVDCRWWDDGRQVRYSAVVSTPVATPTRRGQVKKKRKTKRRKTKHSKTTTLSSSTMSVGRWDMFNF